MSSLVYWLLAGSVVLAVIIMFVTFIIMRAKINGVKKEYVFKGNNEDNDALKREDHGELLWDLKEKTKNPLDDASMEFAINTALRNKYKRLYIDGFKEKYEEKTMIQKTSIKKSDATFDFGLINFNDETIDKISDVIKRAEPKSMVLIVNAKKGKQTKDMMSFMKYTGIRHEHQNIGEGIIILAK